MNPGLVFALLVGYFGALFLIAYLTSRRVHVRSFTQGSRTVHWAVIAFGMVGVSLSGVSFISVPGWVRESNFHYLQMVLGYVVGYYVIAYVLLPVYYRLKIPSIYSYLGERFGRLSYRTGASLFLVSRLVISSFRLFVVSLVLHDLLFSHWGVPFALTVCVTLALIWLYTYRAGIQTIIWTDTFQTAIMLLALLLTVVCLWRELDFGLVEGVRAIAESPNARVFLFDDWKSSHHFVKQFLSGAFIPVVMTGLDQNMMQKNLACRNLRDAQRNMVCYGYSFIPINLLLLSLGVLLLLFAQREGIGLPERSDQIYPLLAAGGWLPQIVGLLFTLGVISAAFSSADSALTAMTTSFTLDILGVGEDEPLRLRRVLRWVHVAVSLAIVGLILLFRVLAGGTVIDALFTAVSYTYGPLLGLFAYGIFTRRRLREWVVPIASVVAPLACYGVKLLALRLWGYQVGYELLLLNGALMFAVLWATRPRV